MKSRPLNTNNLALNSPLSELLPYNPKAVEGLTKVGHSTVQDILWIIPHRYQEIPPIAPFDKAVVGSVFSGAGKVLSCEVRPVLKYGRQRRQAPLSNIILSVKDYFGHKTLRLQWFNAYPNMVKKIKGLSNISFYGSCSEFRGYLQIINPEVKESSYQKALEEQAQGRDCPLHKIQYPTVNGVAPNMIKKAIEKIPVFLWDQIEENLSSEILQKNRFLPLGETFQVIHGKLPYEKSRFEAAKGRLIYEEFFQEQVKFFGRRLERQECRGLKLTLTPSLLKEAKELFSYSLTQDQLKAIDEIVTEITSGTPMMKLLQGDVGCGKTSVALAASFFAIGSGYQVAFMCPTESLALQHFMNVQNVFEGRGIRTELLLGSGREKEKQDIKRRLVSGQINLLIGTHSLIQENVVFASLGLSIIDEQHKFGVNQRVRLIEKNPGSHCLIMTATPIPRSLGLTRYGDLSLVVIKSQPTGRKGTKTRIVYPDEIGIFLDFLHTRLEMGEQAYVVVPAIKESETLDIANVEKVFRWLQKVFPKRRLSTLHGQLKAYEKAQIFRDFQDAKNDLLIATSMVEVGINVINATVMAVLSPERFGLSSLHQLRGRVGRGEKPGFFFLLGEKKKNSLAHKRMKILEKTSDGFEISEEDLRLRGRGDLFGVEQSGVRDKKRLASIVEHQEYLFNARLDVDQLIAANDPYLFHLVENYRQDSTVTKTI